jgi:ankyrin repeat protein
MGQTALFEVAQSADVDVVAYLVEQGMDVNARANDGGTPLIAAVDAAGSRSETIQYLLSHGADPHARDNQGRAAVDFTRERNNFDTVPLLEAAMTR